MDIEILLYEIIVSKKLGNTIWKRILNYLNPETYVFRLYYRVSEDRFWFIKKYNGKIVDSHHTKNYFNQSINIMDGILKRINDFIFFFEYDVAVYELKNQNGLLYNQISKTSKEPVSYNKENQKSNYKQYSKKPIDGIFLSSDPTLKIEEF